MLEPTDLLVISTVSRGAYVHAIRCHAMLSMPGSVNR